MYLMSHETWNITAGTELKRPGWSTVQGQLQAGCRKQAACRGRAAQLVPSHTGWSKHGAVRGGSGRSSPWSSPAPQIESIPAGRDTAKSSSISVAAEEHEEEEELPRAEPSSDGQDGHGAAEAPGAVGRGICLASMTGSSSEGWA